MHMAVPNIMCVHPEYLLMSQCAVAHGIPILHSSWLYNIYTAWGQGDDLDMEECMQDHQLPRFSGICVALASEAAMSPKRRDELITILRQEQGSYVSKVKRPVKVTHMLCSSLERTENVELAVKFNKMKEAT